LERRESGEQHRRGGWELGNGSAAIARSLVAEGIPCLLGEVLNLCCIGQFAAGEHRSRQLRSVLASELVHERARGRLDDVVEMRRLRIGMREQPRVDLFGGKQLIDHGRGVAEERPELRGLLVSELGDSSYMALCLHHQRPNPEGTDAVLDKPGRTLVDDAAGEGYAAFGEVACETAFHEPIIGTREGPD
jgi:hypothetical protein